MERYIKHRLMLGDSNMKLALLTLLVLCAVSTSAWAGQPPPNDDCQDATPVGVPSMTIGATFDATSDTAPDCGGAVSTTRGVWYTVVGTGNTMTASTCNETTNYDTELSIYCDDCDDLTCVGGNDDDPCVDSNSFSRFSWCSQAGATYRVFVHGDEGGDVGNFQLDITDDGTTCEGAIECPGPPTRDINVIAIAICAAPVGVEPHDGGDGEVCLCFGRFFNGFNATKTQPNGQCAPFQTGPFCFVDTLVGPLFWKETVRRQTGPTPVEPGDVVEEIARCPEGKMVLSCQGAVTVGEGNETAANVASNTFPTANGLACRHVARADTVDPCTICPCPYFDFPTNDDCWGTTPGTIVFSDEPQNEACLIDGGAPTLMAVLDPGNPARCDMLPFDPDCGLPFTLQGITPAQGAGCRRCLEKYAAALEAAGYDVANGPPFMCTDP